MQKLATIIFIILYQLGMCAGITADQPPTQYLGTPSSESYSEKQIKSRIPWDMVLIDDKIYLGGGDYNDNTGPVDIWCYDPATQEWSVSATLNDEAIGKFITVGDRVYAPGFDSKKSTWEVGNYHWFENGQWHTNASLPEAVHNFDIAEYNDRLFFALGTQNKNISPVKVSSDDGLTFEDVLFYKDGIDVCKAEEFDFARVYDFFIINDTLYCMFISVQNGKTQTYDFYKYDNDAFYFVSTHEEIGLFIKALKQEPISSKATYKGHCYIAAGYLSRTRDFTSSDRLTLPQGELAIDLLVDDDTLYVLCAAKNEETYSTRIYSYVYNSFFYQVASFDSENMPMSFVKDENTFYIGFSSQGNDQSAAGNIYEITVPTQKMNSIPNSF